MKKNAVIVALSFVVVVMSIIIYRFTECEPVRNIDITSRALAMAECRRIFQMTGEQAWAELAKSMIGPNE